MRGVLLPILILGTGGESLATINNINISPPNTLIPVGKKERKNHHVM